jgi:hypothetical protein
MVKQMSERLNREFVGVVSEEDRRRSRILAQCSR